MSLGIELMLVHVLHVIVRSLLVKRGFIRVFEADKVILTKNTNFVGK